MRVSFDLADYAPADQGDAWRTAASELFVPVHVTPAADQPAVRLSTCDVAGLRAISLRATAGEIVRDSALVSADDEPYLLVGLQLSGSSVATQARRESIILKGDLECQITTRPYAYRFPSSFDKVMVRLPIAGVGLSSNILDRVSGLPIPSGTGVSRLLASLLTDFVANAPGYVGAGEHELGGAISELIRATILNRLGTDDSRTAHTALRTSILDFIEQNLHDPALSPGSVAAALHISPRYLHRVLAEAGTTFGTSLRQRRMRAISHELRSSSATHRTVQSIAASYGFRNPAYFSRLFKNTYGMPPHRWRSGQ